MESSFHYLIMKNQVHFYKTAFSYLNGSGLTFGQPKILDYLKNHNGCAQKEIAAGCCVDKATVTSLLLRMEEAGLIERKQIDTDRRSHFVYLTDKGKILNETVRDAFKSAEELAFNGFSEKERNLFMNMLERICENLEQNTK